MVRARFVAAVVCFFALAAACSDGVGGPSVVGVGGDSGQPDLGGGADGAVADAVGADGSADTETGVAEVSGDAAVTDAPGTDAAADGADSVEQDAAAPDADVAETGGPDAVVMPCASGCPKGASCVDGQCVCEVGLALCPSGCVNLALNQANCHACGVAAAGETCNGVDDDCDGETDENFRDDATGLFYLDNACGGCGTNCQEIYDVSHAYGVCDVSSGQAECRMVCCEAGQISGSCDGYAWVDTNGDPANGCETADIAACGVHGDCVDGQFCDGGTCAPNGVGGPCESDANCSGSDICVGGLCGCTGEQYASSNVPPNVLIVLDRSGSMNESAGGGQTKWKAAKAAIGELTTSFEDQARFGLMLYPGTNQKGNKGSKCGAGVVFVHPALANASAVTTFLAGAGTTSFGTPTAEALTALATQVDIADPARANVVVLITDGQSSCGKPVPAVTALLAKGPSVRTFVIGFGKGVDAGELNAMAKAGGTALPGNTAYYQAGDAASLGQALASIAGSVLGCTFALEKAPPSLDALHAYLDGVESGRDTSQTDGWDYDGGQAQVTFYGAACEALKSGEVKKLVFIYGCDDGHVIGGG